MERLKMKAITLSISILALTLATQALAQETEAPAAKAQNTVFGVWETARVPEEGEDTIAHIKIEPCKNNPNNACGKIIFS